MTLKTVKVLVLGSTIVFLAAGCNSSQPQANSQNSSQTQTSPASSNAPSPGQRTASSTAGHFGMQNLPSGSKPIFGTISAVSGSQITVSGRSKNSSSTASTIIDITSSTKLQGGAQSALVAGVRVAGYGTANSDGSINAVNLQINPSFSGRGQGGGHYGAGSQSQSQSSQ